MPRTVASRYCWALASVIGLSGSPALADDASTSEGLPLRVRVLELDGLLWRTELYNDLQLVERQGSATAWLAKADVLGRLVAAARQAPDTVDPSRPANGPKRNYVGWMRRVANGPVNRSSAIAFKADMGQIDPEGIECGLQGSRVEAGTQVGGTIRDTRFIAFHTAGYEEAVGPRNTSLLSVLFGGGQTTIMAQYQVPEVISSSVTGRWRIPAGEALVIGLGAHTVPTAGSDRSVLRERVVVVDAGDIDEASFLRGLREKAVQEPVRSPRARILTLASAVAVLVAVLCVAWSILWVRRGGRSAKREAASTSETRAPV